MVVGDFFADVQGGTFSSSVASRAIDFMKNHGAYGVGQSSWGPAIYGLIKGEIKAINLKSEVESLLQANEGGHVFVASANNRGATVKKFEI